MRIPSGIASTSCIYTEISPKAIVWEAGVLKLISVEGHQSGNCEAANKAYEYHTVVENTNGSPHSNFGKLKSKTDWSGNVTTYTHNDRGQEISRTEASGTPQVRTITTEWHSEFNLPTRIIEPERETIMFYDANGRLLSRQIQPRSN